MRQIKEMSNTVLLAYYRDTVINWWEDNYEMSSVYGTLLERIETELRKRMKGYDSTGNK